MKYLVIILGSKYSLAPGNPNITSLQSYGGNVSLLNERVNDGPDQAFISGLSVDLIDLVTTSFPMLGLSGREK